MVYSLGSKYLVVGSHDDEIYLYDTGLDEDSITRLTDARPKVFVNGG